MHAAQIKKYGDPSVVEVTDIATPTISDDQVLVAVHASSLNPFDTTMREGRAQQMSPLRPPFTLGGDIAGVVEAVGAKVTDFAVGDRVFGQANAIAGNSGALAEHAATASTQIAIAPSTLNFAQAASLPLVGVSALQALTEHIELRAGQKILITGGAGGIGRSAIQLAKHLGAYVATTVGTSDIETVTALGADEAIDYTSQDFTELLSGYDAVFDTVGSEEFSKALGILRRGGIAVSMIAQVDQARADELGVTAVSQFTQVTTAKLNRLRKLVEAGAIKPQVGKIFALRDIRDAFVARESGAVSGKIVIAIRD